MKRPDAVATFTAMSQARTYPDDDDMSNSVIFGRVELAGKVIEHRPATGRSVRASPNSYR